LFHARKRTKKTTAKSGRPKKAKKDQADEGSSVQCSSRTRLAVAREAADRVAKAAQLAADKATVAAAKETAKEAPLETIYQAPGSPPHLQGTISFFTVHFAKY